MWPDRQTSAAKNVAQTAKEEAANVAAEAKTNAQGPDEPGEDPA